MKQVRVESSGEGRADVGPVAHLSPIAQLERLAGQGANGELVCSCPEGEVHFFLQGGRIAWASDSRNRHAFTGHLKKLAQLGEGAMEEVVAECRRTKRPIGETLVQWKLATRDQVRESLRRQVALAIDVAGCQGEGRAVFLPRQYVNYDPDFTFSPSDFIPGAGSDALVQGPGGPGAADEGTFRLHDEPESRTGAGEELGAGPNNPTEDDGMMATEKLKELQSIDGFSGAAVFTPTGEQLAMLEGDAPRLKEVGIMANNVLINSQKASLEMGTGRGQQVHVEAEKAHILVRCLNEGTDPLKSQPGKAHIHLVLVLKTDASIGMAKLRINSAVQKLAEEFRF
jgi:predicted regulator of Ras-like GTPase activity (Roadblock/LC7/MglB family)